MGLTKKQISEFARHYIANQMFMIDGGNIGNVPNEVDELDSDKIVKEINRQGQKYSNGRRLDLMTPSAILRHVKKNF